MNMSTLLLKFSRSIDYDLAVAPTGKVGKGAKRSTYQSTAVTVRDTSFKIK